MLGSRFSELGLILIQLGQPQILFCLGSITGTYLLAKLLQLCHLLLVLLHYRIRFLGVGAGQTGLFEQGLYIGHVDHFAHYASTGVGDPGRHVDQVTGQRTFVGCLGPIPVFLCLLGGGACITGFFVTNDQFPVIQRIAVAVGSQKFLHRHLIGIQILVRIHAVLLGSGGLSQLLPFLICLRRRHRQYILQRFLICVYHRQCWHILGNWCRASNR